MSAPDPAAKTSTELGCGEAVDLLVRPVPAPTAATILWRASGEVAWRDGCAQELIAACFIELTELLGGDVRSLGRGKGSAMVERLVAARSGGWVRARTTVCPAVAGVDAVTTLEVVKTAGATSLDLATKFQLTERELKIALLVSEGLGNRAISYRVDLAVPTVGMYLTRIFKKTGTLDRQDLSRLVLTGLPDSRPAPLRPSGRAPAQPERPAPSAPPPTRLAVPPLTAQPPIAPQPAVVAPGAWRTPAPRRGRAGRRWRGP